MVRQAVAVTPMDSVLHRDSPGANGSWQARPAALARRATGPLEITHE
jgi:hypothetical protein